ncbi:MAG TPA: BACON domain-containing carbohydrate-binding protein [Verrucomicrobiae bacterium]
MTGKLWWLVAAVSLLCFAPTGQGAARVIRAQGMNVAPGQTNRLLISLESAGDVFALNFNIGYDTNLLTFVQAVAGTDAVNLGAALNVNSKYTTNSGILRLSLGFFSGATFPSGTNVLVEVYFGATAGVASASTAVTFTNQPIAPEVSDADAQILPVSFVGGTVLIQCNYSLNTNAAFFTAAAGTSSVNLTADAGCAWTIINTNPWVAITSPTNGAGSATVNLSVIANSNLATRVGTIVIAGRNFTVTQQGLVCSYALSSPGQTHTAAMETNFFNVILTNPCPWSVSNTNSWIVLLSGSSGAGSGTVTYSVEANPALSPRIGTLLIQNQAFTVTQQAVICTYTLSSSNHTHTAASETNSFNVAVNTPCPWSVSNANSWITILSGNGGAGNGTVTYSVAPNVSTSARGGVLLIAGQIFTISQPGIDCAYALVATNAAHSAAAVTNNFSIKTSNSCPWSVSNTNGWMAILAGSNGNGDGVVTYSVEANPSPAQRIGTLLIGNQTFTVTQDGIICSYALSARGFVHSAAAETNSVGLSTTTLCSWFAVNTNQWISILAGSNGIGSGTVAYSVAGNASLSERTATLLIAGETFSITQRAVVCTYTLSASNRTHTAASTTSSFNVNVPTPCPWTVDNTNSWITILAGSNGIGSGVVTYAIPANTISLERTGTLTIGSQIFTLTQQGIVCSYSMSPTKRTHGPGAVGNTFTVNSATGCLWSVVNTNPWIHLVGDGTGFGFMTNSYTVEANPLSVERIGYITVPGASLLITQRTSCSFTFSPSSLSHNSSAGSNSVSVTVGATCAWTATTTNNWITILGGSGTGNGSFSYSVLANSSAASRTGAVVVAGQTLPVVQEGASFTGGFAFQSLSLGLLGEISLCITGGPTGVWQLQVSPDLVGWTKLADLTNSTGRVDYINPGPAGSNQFFRAFLP